MLVFVFRNQPTWRSRAQIPTLPPPFFYLFLLLPVINPSHPVIQYALTTFLLNRGALMSITMVELSPKDWFDIVGTTITVIGAIAVLIRWLWNKHTAAIEVIDLGAIDPKGYDPQLPQKESDLLSSYLQLVQALAQDALATFPGVKRNLPLEKILITPRLGAKEYALLGQTGLPSKNSSAEFDDFDLDKQLDSGAILPWPQLRTMDDTFMVMGPAGAGKSTLLRHEAFLCAEALTRAGARWDDPQNPIPVILRVDEVHTLCILQGKDLRQAVQWKVSEVLQAAKPLDDKLPEILDQCVADAWDAHCIRLLLDAHEELMSEDARSSVLKLLQSHLVAEGCPLSTSSAPARRNSDLAPVSAPPLPRSV